MANFLGNIYSDIDLRYANEKDLVTMATGRIMIVEIVMDVIALLLVSYFTTFICFRMFSAKFSFQSSGFTLV